MKTRTEQDVKRAFINGLIVAAGVILVIAMLFNQ